MRTLVTFRAVGFNTTDVRPHFLNDDNFGEDVAAWLVQELTNRGQPVEPEIGQEDHGWYFTFAAGDHKYDFIVGFRENDGAEWIGWIERSVGLIGSLFGGRRRGIEPAAPATIHQVLAASPDVSAISWHHEAEFSRGVEDRGTPDPLAA